MAEWSCSGLQSRLRRFDSDPSLQNPAPDVIELQLAHAERNKVRAAYNKAQRLPERRKMMQAWADYLDGLRAGGQIVPIKRRLP